MPVQPESKLGPLIEALREGLPTVRVRFGEWVAACREEPALIWQTPAVRYAVYTIGGLVLVSILSATMNLFAPAEVVPKASTADFHVICGKSGCGQHFVINREFRFDAFPVTCPKCEERAGERAARCHSTTCKGRWVIPARDKSGSACPQCGAPIRTAD